MENTHNSFCAVCREMMEKIRKARVRIASLEQKNKCLRLKLKTAKKDLEQLWEETNHAPLSDTESDDDKLDQSVKNIIEECRQYFAKKEKD